MALQRWQASASLILINQNRDLSQQSMANHFEYETLILKRSDQTTVFPNHCVFPGGLLDDFDESIEWLQYFEEFGVPQSALQELISLSEHRPYVLLPQGTGCYDRFFKKSRIWAREISLRLAALRETFEEAGILLCRRKDQIHSKRGVSYVKDDFDKTFWQNAVHNDAHAFLRLCRELVVVPDIWSLYEWSAWATPAIAKKKFATVFFMAFLCDTVTVLPEPTEVKEALWLDPQIAITKYQMGDIWFLPPQLYEICRLQQVRSFNDLLKFTVAREFKGLTLFIPITYSCTDGMVSVLQGDDYFLENPWESIEIIEIDMSIEEFRAKTKNVHRSESVGSGNMNIQLNVTPFNGHLPPMKLTQHSKL